VGRIRDQILLKGYKSISLSIYIYIDGGDKKFEWDMYAVISNFQGSHDRYDGYEK